MQFRTLTAKYPGVCRRCKLAFDAGSRIRYAGPGATWHLAAECGKATQAGASAPAPTTQEPQAPLSFTTIAGATVSTAPPPIASPRAPRARKQATPADVHSRSNGAAGYSPLADDDCEF